MRDRTVVANDIFFLLSFVKVVINVDGQYRIPFLGHQVRGLSRWLSSN